MGFVVSLAAGVVILCQNKRRPLNIVFACSCLFVSLWSFTEFMFRQAESYAAADFWIRARALAWPFPLAFLFHFLLIFAKKRKWLEAKTTLLLIYGPVVLISALDVGTHSITGLPVLKPWGYTFDIPDTLLNWLCTGWTALLGILALILALHCYFRIQDRKKKIQAKYIALGISFPIVGGILSEILLPLLGIRIPELTSVAMTGLALFIGYAIWKYELFAVSPAMAAENIIATMNEMLFLLNPEGEIIRTNRKSREVLGHEESELIGRPLGVVMSDAAAGRGLIDRMIKEGSIQNAEIPLRTKPGGQIPAIFSGSLIKSRKGLILGIVGVARDISERKRLEEDLRALSLVDELTGLYNRRGFLTLARHQQKISARTGKEMLLAYADVDGLKRINDTFGHDAGDAVLVEIGKIIKESFRGSDLTARLGGDEFAVLAPETSAPCSEQLKARLEEKVRSRLAGSASPFKLSLSIGMICCDPREPDSIEELLAKADLVMYAQKPGRKTN